MEADCSSTLLGHIEQSVVVGRGGTSIVQIGSRENLKKCSWTHVI